jgi:potassium efflux system protein
VNLLNTPNVLAHISQLSKLTVSEASYKMPAIWKSTLFEIGDTPVTVHGIVQFALVLIIALFLSWLTRRALARVQQTRSSDMQAAYYAVSRVVHYIIIIGAVLFGLSIIGLDLSRFTLFISALGVGLGFGMQAIIGNFVSGLIILFEQHLKIGDYVELESGVTGEVRAINIRATRITTNDNIDVLVPNSEFVNGRVVNWTLEDISRRIHVKFGVSYQANKGAVREAVLKAALTVPFTRNDEKYHPQVWLTGFGDSSMEFELVVWLGPEAVKRPSVVQAAYYWAIDDALEEAGIEIPFPQRDLHVRSLFGLEGNQARQFLKPEAKQSQPEMPKTEVKKAVSANDALEEAVRLSSEKPDAPDESDQHKP